MFLAALILVFHTKNFKILIKLGINDISINVVVTSQNMAFEEIAAISKDHHNIVLHKDLPSLSSLVACSDLFIGSRFNNLGKMLSGVALSCYYYRR